mmetsp:Transcript_4469/g.11543  ORF Transcript_4469/g.11543 Transcript_4469/m.11543 type:complete len:268 (+) Transcript_4469:171-974(+)
MLNPGSYPSGSSPGLYEELPGGFGCIARETFTLPRSPWNGPDLDQSPGRPHHLLKCRQTLHLGTFPGQSHLELCCATPQTSPSSWWQPKWSTHHERMGPREGRLPFHSWRVARVVPCRTFCCNVRNRMSVPSRFACMYEVSDPGLPSPHRSFCCLSHGRTNPGTSRHANPPSYVQSRSWVASTDMNPRQVSTVLLYVLASSVASSSVFGTVAPGIQQGRTRAARLSCHGNQDETRPRACCHYSLAGGHPVVRRQLCCRSTTSRKRLM